MKWWLLTFLCCALMPSGASAGFCSVAGPCSSDADCASSSPYVACYNNNCVVCNCKNSLAFCDAHSDACNWDGSNCALGGTGFAATPEIPADLRPVLYLAAGALLVWAGRRRKSRLRS